MFAWVESGRGLGDYFFACHAGIRGAPEIHQALPCFPESEARVPDGVAGAAGREGWGRAIDSQCRAGSDRFSGRLGERVRRVRVGVWFQPRDDWERGRAAEPDIGPAGSLQAPPGHSANGTVPFHYWARS